MHGTATTAGNTIHAIAGRHTITLTNNRTYRVETRTGSIVGQEIPELSASFNTEQCARLVARTITRAFRDGLCANDVRDEVKDTLHHELAGEYLRRYKNHAYLTDLERAVDMFTEPADRAALDELAAMMYGTITGKAMA